MAPVRRGPQSAVSVPVCRHGSPPTPLAAAGGDVFPASRQWVRSVFRAAAVLAADVAGAVSRHLRLGQCHSGGAGVQRGAGYPSSAAAHPASGQMSGGGLRMGSRWGTDGGRCRIHRNAARADGRSAGMGAAQAGPTRRSTAAEAAGAGGCSPSFPSTACGACAPTRTCPLPCCVCCLCCR